jgi:hypothetical protein
LARDTTLVSGRVKAASFPLQLNLYKNGNTTPDLSLTVGDGHEFAVPSSLGFFDSLTVDFIEGTAEELSDGNGTAQDFNVRELWLFAREASPIEAEGVSLINPPHMLGHYFKSPDLMTFSCGAIEAPDYSGLILTVTPTGGAAVPVPVNGPELFQLPRNLPHASQWRIDVTANQPITSLTLTPRSRVPVEGKTLHVLAPDPRLQPWIYTRYEFTESVTPVSCFVKSAVYPVMFNICKDGSAAVSQSIIVNDGKEFRIDPPAGDTTNGRLSTLDFFFTDMGVPPNPMDDFVHEIFFFCYDPLAIDGNGWVMRNGDQVFNFVHRTLHFKDSGKFCALRIAGAIYPQTMTLYADGVQVCQIVVSGDDEIRLPITLPNAREWEFDLDRVGEENEIHLLASVAHQIQEGRVLIRKQDDPFTWLGHRFLADRPTAFSCGRIVAENYPVTLNIYQRQRLVLTRQVTSDSAFRLPRLRPEREWEIDIVETPGNEVIEVALATGMDALRY